MAPRLINPSASLRVASMRNSWRPPAPPLMCVHCSAGFRNVARNSLSFASSAASASLQERRATARASSSSSSTVKSAVAGPASFEQASASRRSKAAFVLASTSFLTPDASERASAFGKDETFSGKASATAHAPASSSRSFDGRARRAASAARAPSARFASLSPEPFFNSKSTSGVRAATWSSWSAFAACCRASMASPFVSGSRNQSRSKLRPAFVAACLATTLKAAPDVEPSEATRTSRSLNVEASSRIGTEARGARSKQRSRALETPAASQ